MQVPTEHNSADPSSSAGFDSKKGQECFHTFDLCFVLHVVVFEPSCIPLFTIV